jgi:F-type H+-transporting ATPase subunit epsilon
MKTVPVEIITPEKVFVREDAEFVVIPGADGELGVLPGHARLLAWLKPGTIRLDKSGGGHKYTISGGMVFVEPTLIKIFTTTVQPV